LVIIGGGDGTLNAAVDALVDTNLPLGILPLGTANDLARTLEIPTSLPKACEIIAKGTSSAYRLGMGKWQTLLQCCESRAKCPNYPTAYQGNQAPMGNFCLRRYCIAAIWQTRPFSAEIRLNGNSIRVKTFQIAVGNGRYYGGGMAVVTMQQLMIKG
jgi:diacylglycerol kinase family enzyme